MNILFLDQYSDLGGAQRCLIDLIPAVVARGWRAQVAAPGNGALRERVEALGATFHEIQCGPYESGGKSIANLLRFPVELPKLAREIASLGGDIVYVNGPRLMPAAALASRRSVFHCHSRLKHHYDAALVGIAIASSQASLIASCHYVTEPLRPYVSRFDVVYNGVEGRRVPKSASKIGVIGRIGEEKGQLEFVEMARLLPNDYQFVICGLAVLKPRRDSVLRTSSKSSRRPANRVHRLAGDISEVLSQLAVLIVPSMPGEATTRVILEAYAAGVPVIATKSGGIPEIVEDGETGYLVADADPRKLAAKVQEVNPRVARKMRTKHGERATRWSIIRREFWSILERARA